MRALLPLLLFLIVPIVFTAWGWQHIINPILWPLLKLWGRLLVIVVWVGFAFSITGSGWFYRAFGVGMGDLIIALAPSEKARHYAIWHREDTITLDGHWEPHWREHHGLPSLPPDWEGPIEHALSAWWLPVILLVIVGAVYVLTKMESMRQARRAATHSSKGITERLAQLGALMGTVDVSRLPARQTVLPVPVQNVSDKEFEGALKGLGFKITEIRRVAPMCQGVTLESRLIEALKLLT